MSFERTSNSLLKSEDNGHCETSLEVEFMQVPDSACLSSGPKNMAYRWRPLLPVTDLIDKRVVSFLFHLCGRVW